jgi:hypothetical protein
MSHVNTGRVATATNKKKASKFQIDKRIRSESKIASIGEPTRTTTTTDTVDLSVVEAIRKHLDIQAGLVADTRSPEERAALMIEIQRVIRDLESS